jgi:hypothetical protein
MIQSLLLAFLGFAAVLAVVIYLLPSQNEDENKK